MFLGYIAEYFSYIEPTDDQFRDVCLFSLGLVLTGLLASFAHAYGFFMGVRASMDARIITTSAIYQKVHVLYCVVQKHIIGSACISSLFMLLVVILPLYLQEGACLLNFEIILRCP